jgi:hypothetical protein
MIKCGTGTSAKIDERSIPLDFQHSVWAYSRPQNPCHAPWGEREIGRFEIGVSAGPVLPSIYREVDGRELYEIEDVATRLALPPFDYHYGVGNDRFDAGGWIDRSVQDRDGQSVGGDGQNEDDLTNLEWWVRGKMFITLETRCEEYMTAITPCVITSLPSDPFA